MQKGKSYSAAYLISQKDTRRLNIEHTGATVADVGLLEVCVQLELILIRRGLGQLFDTVSRLIKNVLQTHDCACPERQLAEK
jgi:hypothetical protein